MRLSEFDITHRHPATVASSTRLALADSPDEVRDIEIDVPARPFSASVPGLSVGVLAPGRAQPGEPHHLRLYTVADLPEAADAGRIRLRLCVKRCSRVDEATGERFPGTASNFLCDLPVGGTLTVTGPYGLAFSVPDDPGANLVLIGAGTGIAPFRAFVKYLYAGGFTGRVLLLHGGRSGLDRVYKNDEHDDVALYYDQGTFEAISALAPLPIWSDAIDWKGVVAARAKELSDLLVDSHTYVYVAGIESILGDLDVAFAAVMGGPERWAARKAELQAGKRWVELVY